VVDSAVSRIGRRVVSDFGTRKALGGKKGGTRLSEDSMDLLRLFDSKSAATDASDQRSLTQLLIDVAEGRKNDRDLKKFLLQRAWSKPSAGRRVVDALRKVKLHRADLYERAKEIVEPIYMAL
jgi:hypothetical protein